MNAYNVYTQCGVVTKYNANNSFLAAELARNDGWLVVMVIRFK